MQARNELIETFVQTLPCMLKPAVRRYKWRNLLTCSVFSLVQKGWTWRWHRQCFKRKLVAGYDLLVAYSIMKITWIQLTFLLFLNFPSCRGPLLLRSHEPWHIYIYLGIWFTKTRTACTFCNSLIHHFSVYFTLLQPNMYRNNLT